MTNKISESARLRPLFIRFDDYTDGDAGFKKELIELMIDNLVELRQTLRLASQQNDVHLFRRVCHKIKPTLDMLGDRELLDTIEDLKSMTADPLQITLMTQICTDIIESLGKE
jgi:hypothetical protein